jgi:hypothetical protein
MYYINNVINNVIKIKYNRLLYIYINTMIKLAVRPICNYKNIILNKICNINIYENRTHSKKNNNFYQSRINDVKFFIYVNTKNKCEYCNGSRILKCLNCGGIGHTYNTNKKESCDDCTGAGYIPCVICSGTGESCLAY